MDPTLMLFYEHVSKGRKDDAQKMILDGAIDASEKYLVPVSPLSTVVEKGWYDVVELLLDRGADANYGGRNGKFPLYAATKKYGQESDEILQLLLDRGASVDLRFMNGNTPFLEAVKHKDLTKMKILLEAGSDIHAINNGGDSAMHMAAIQGNITMAKELINAGCHVQNTFNGSATKWQKVNPGLSPLHYTAFGVMGGHPAMAELLLQYGADVDLKIPDSGRTALHLCAIRDATLTAKVLINHGCQLNLVSIENNELKTPLHKAIDGNNVGMVVELAKAGADLDITCQHFMTPLMLALTSHLSNKATIIKCLLQEGCQVNIRTKNISHFITAVNLDAAAEQQQGTEQKTQTCTLFTEMLLKAGYKIDESDLLMARNNLQPRSLYQYIMDHGSNPDTLQQICRLSIRQKLKRVISFSIDKLHLPPRLKDYLHFGDIYVM